MTSVKTERSARSLAPPQLSLRPKHPLCKGIACRTIPSVAEPLGVTMNTDKPTRPGTRADHLSNDPAARTRAGRGWVSDVARLMFAIAAVLTAVSHLFSAIGG